MRLEQPLVTGVLAALVAASACSDHPDVAHQIGDGGATGSGGTTEGTGGSVISVGGDNTGDGGEGGLSTGDPCSGNPCPEDQHCEVDGDSYDCVPNDCDTLTCSDNEECQPTANGAWCVSLVCDEDVDCAPERWCDTDAELCVDDTCASGERQCSGADVLECAPNGSGFEVLVTCEATTTFDSECVDLGGGSAGCSCEDDWDCPDYQECEAGICRGNPEPPTCRLPALDITAVLPSPEIQWGGETTADVGAKLRLVDGVDVSDGPDSPWPNSGQVVHTPIVANLDDDNGDGLIDERDFPEIVFLTFEQSNDATANGMLRAIHGGGADQDGNPKKGRDYLAVCTADKRWFGGVYYDEDDNVLDSPSCGGNEPDLDSTSTIAVGDLDYDGVPEIVAVTESSSDGNTDFNKREGALAVYDNEGRRIFRYPEAENEYLLYPNNSDFHNPAPALANVIVAADPDDELAEIVIGSDLFVLEKVDGALRVQKRFQGGNVRGKNAQGPIPCIADLAPDRPGLEIIAGATVYGVPEDLNDDSLVVLANDGSRDGFCAIADVWGPDPGVPPGPDNDPATDRQPEIVLVSSGDVYVYSFGLNGTDYELTELTGGLDLPGADGGPPNVDDFDGDGFAEIGTAGATTYMVFDLQEPVDDYCPEWTTVNDGLGGTLPRVPPTLDCNSCAAGTVCNSSLDDPQCVCLHNGWRRETEDGSSRVTGSSVFDFNGDGAAEVVYNDECRFRIYSGLDGTELLTEWSESRTRTEYPIVADIDNDGNAEIVFATSNESGFCDDPDQPDDFNNGIEVWGDPDDRWVSARRVWNQHAYHVTNITESLGIPRIEPPNWRPLGNRLYNTYRSQPRSFGVAPDLVIEAIQVSSPDAACGELSNSLLIAVQVRNAGDLRVGPGVEVAFQGIWGEEDPVGLLDEDGNPLVYVIANSLEPNDSLVFQLPYEATYNSESVRPDSIIATVDPTSPGKEFGAERECNDDNNSREAEVEPGEALADLTIQLTTPDDDCPDPTAHGRITNIGALPASDIVVRIYAGNPEAGGESLGELTIEGPLDSGESEDFELLLTRFPANKRIRLYGVVDPDDKIRECNDGNNKDGPTEELICVEIE